MTAADRATESPDVDWRAVVSSERIAELQQRIARGEEPTRVAADFWEAAEATPLWERDPDVADAWRATFLWRGDPELTRHVTLCGPLVFSEYFVGGIPFAQLAGTDVWHLTLRLPPGTRSTYAVNPNGITGRLETGEAVASMFATLVRDPLNPRTFLTPANELWPRFTPTVLSVLEAPDAPAQRWRLPQPGVAAGEVVEHAHSSAALGNTRRVWTYTPPGWKRDEREYPLLIAFDGWHAVHLARLPVVLDNLIAAGEIPPLVAVMVDCGTVEMRARELDCHEPFVTYLAEEIVPWACARWGLLTDRSRTLLAGVSLGGRAAVHAALRRPDVFGKVIAQAAAVTESGERAIDALGLRPARPSERLELSLDIGLLEIDSSGRKAFLPGVQRLCRLLRAAGHDADHVELACGHDAEIVYAETIADRLRQLLPAYF